MFVRSGLRLSLAGLALLALSQAAPAQTKVGIVNLQRAVLESAEIKAASVKMEAKYKPRQAELEKLQKELEGLQQQLQSQAGKLTPQAEADITAQGQRKQRDFQRLSDDLQQDVNAERNDILSASGRRMQEIVQKVAEARTLDLVVDVSNAVYFKPALDITADVLAAYDKAYPVK